MVGIRCCALFLCFVDLQTGVKYAVKHFAGFDGSVHVLDCVSRVHNPSRGFGSVFVLFFT